MPISKNDELENDLSVEDKEAWIEDFIQALSESQKDLDPAILDDINENFWDLV